MRLNISGYEGEVFWVFVVVAFFFKLSEVYCPMSLVFQPEPFRADRPGTSNTGMHDPDEMYFCFDTYTMKKDQLT